MPDPLAHVGHCRLNLLLEAAQLHEQFASMRDNDVREIALRASDLSPAALKMIRNLIEDTRRIEGLSDAKE